MLFDEGPIVPIDEPAFMALVRGDNPEAMTEAIAPIVSELHAHADALDVTHDTFAAAGEAPPDDDDELQLVTVLVEAGDLVDNPELHLDDRIAVELDAGDVDITQLTSELANEAALHGPPPAPLELLTQEEIDAFERAHPFIVPPA